MPNTKVERDFIFLMYATVECRRAIQQFEEMISLSYARTEGVQTNPLGKEAAGKIIALTDTGAVAFEHETVFAAMRLGLHFAANASRVFWPARGASKEGIERACRLKNLAGVPDNHPVKQRGARNAFEHLDERLDRWTDPTPRPFLSIEAIILPNAHPQMREQILEGSSVIYDVEARAVILFGQTFLLAVMIDDLKDLQSHISRGIDEIVKAWK
jgi:hypothetical protein